MCAQHIAFWKPQKIFLIADVIGREASTKKKLGCNWQFIHWKYVAFKGAASS